MAENKTIIVKCYKIQVHDVQENKQNSRLS